MNTLNLIYCTRDYIRSHGKAPKGYGRWAFAERFCNGEGDPIFAPRSMTLTEAKKWFRAHLQEQGVTGEFDIVVCP